MGLLKCCCATFSIAGIAHGCNASLNSGVSITVKGHTSGTTIGTASSNGSGVYSVTGTLPGADTAVDVISTKTGYATLTSTFSVTSGANTGKNFTMTVGTGYVCVVPCNDPVRTPFFLSDPFYGTMTTLSTTGVHGTQAALPFAGDAVVPCGARAARCDYTFSGNTLGVVAFAAGTACPGTVLGSTGGNLPITAHSCGAGGAFTATFSGVVGATAGNGSTTLSMLYGAAFPTNATVTFTLSN